ncbi:MAG: MoaD/ThiS family protein [Thermomonas sp.]|uniref:MoaD/ThiS family protein n=1 Tax=Thermomonas sp. TaxID=1971895 RepID=UPI002610C0F5|nr:MoaD/ThiS family protein [Thermomonas sp.]MCC7097533.1 MoaD/ThiS family protein [Thermomonas sp.]
MKVEVKLFGAFRDYEADANVTLDLPADARVEDVRNGLAAYAGIHWPQFCPKLLKCSAFASEHAVLREGDPIPEDGRMAVLPPVSGG